MRAATKFYRLLVLVVIAGLAVLCANAQEQDTKRKSQQDSGTENRAEFESTRHSKKELSALEQQNLSRVAASPAQIKEILIKEPGIFVELKRWIAKEASDNGQVVSDEDLTDTAVFDRLASDVVFRSVATLLVQRYGYLRPNINPDSQMGKEQELLTKERVRVLVQLEAQEDQQSPRTQKAQSKTSKAIRCGPEEDDNCEEKYPYTYPDEDISNPEFGIPQRNVIPFSPNENYPNQEQPPISSPQIMEASTYSDFESGEFPNNDLLFQSISTASRQSGESIGYGANSNAGQMSSGMARLFEQAMSPRSMGGYSAENAYSAIGNQSNNGGYYYRRLPKLVREREPKAAAVEHRPNPYSDIPSLYDLYVQAPSRDRPPQRFGTDVFRDGMRDPRSVPMDLPVGPDYIVGPGDSLAIDLWGGVSTKIVRTVDREGRVTLPEAGPLLVSGRSLGDVQMAIQKAVGTEFRDTSADVSVSRLRTIRVYVVGEVEEPGAYDISSLSTALNALVAAGGVTSRGSLRSLKHMRGQQQIENIDAYDLLLRGVTPTAQKLENGDTLMVPPLGPQVTVTGMVRRPAVYELNGEKSVEDVLELAGGILPAAALRHVEVQRLEAHEKRTMLSLDLSPEDAALSQLTSFKVQDGDEIHIFPIAPYNQDTIYLQGHVLRPGRYSYREGMKLTDLVSTYKDILPEPAAHYAEIIRLNPPDFHPTIVSFDLAAAMKDAAKAPSLEPLDTVRIFSRFDFEPAPTVSVIGEVRKPGTYKTSGQASLRDAVYLAGGPTADAALNTAQLFRINPDGTSKIFSVNLAEALRGNAADNILLQPRDRLLIHRNTSQLDNTVEITGEVEKPGRYPFTENMHVEDLIFAAGGLKRSADTTTADLTRYAASAGTAEQLQISLASVNNGNATEDVPLRSGDVLAIRQIPGWSDIGAAVKISGEVMHPSTYGIEPGERLSTALERAGGYTKQAYPYGAVLTRREVREMEMKNQAELTFRLKEEREHLKDLPEGNNDQINAKKNALAQTDSTLNQLTSNPPIGRVVVHISSDIKQWKGTPSDIVLRDGDTLLIPKKSSVVVVNGQVFNPTAITAQSGKSAKWYLSQAGGLTPIADRKGVFVVRADGSVLAARNNGGGWWIGDPLSASLRPGDTVVVPEKTPKIGGANWMTVLQSAQMASSIALAVAYIHP